jgi:CTP-dependent riboflavin kinase
VAQYVTERSEKALYVDVKEVMRTLGVSRGKAYKIIQQLNEELIAQGYAVLAGKCSRRYFNEKYYNYNSQDQK